MSSTPPETGSETTEQPCHVCLPRASTAHTGMGHDPVPVGRRPMLWPSEEQKRLCFKLLDRVEDTGS